MTFKLGDDWQDAALVITQTIVGDSRTPQKGSKCRAICQINGQQYEAQSRSGTPFALLPDPENRMLALIAPVCPACLALPQMMRTERALRMLKVLYRAKTGKRALGFHFI